MSMPNLLSCVLATVVVAETKAIFVSGSFKRFVVFFCTVAAVMLICRKNFLLIKYQSCHVHLLRDYSQ